jgi:hypothetical protein
MSRSDDWLCFSLSLYLSVAVIQTLKLKIDIVGVESNWVHSTPRPLIGLLCQPWVIMMVEKLVERLAGETEVLGENLPSAALSTTKPTSCPDANPYRRGGKPATNLLSYCTASHTDIHTHTHTPKRIRTHMCGVPMQRNLQCNFGDYFVFPDFYLYLRKTIPTG